LRRGEHQEYAAGYIKKGEEGTVFRSGRARDLHFFGKKWGRPGQRRERGDLEWFEKKTGASPKRKGREEVNSGLGDGGRRKNLLGEVA